MNVFIHSRCPGLGPNLHQRGSFDPQSQAPSHTGADDGMGGGGEGSSHFSGLHFSVYLRSANSHGACSALTGSSPSIRTLPSVRPSAELHLNVHVCFPLSGSSSVCARGCTLALRSLTIICDKINGCCVSFEGNNRFSYFRACGTSPKRF